MITVFMMMATRWSVNSGVIFFTEGYNSLKHFNTVAALIHRFHMNPNT